MPNFVAMAGNTVRSYTNLLAANASYLSELGQFTPEVTRLLAFALQQADNAIPGGILSAAIDGAAPTPGLGLVLTRQYFQPISRRYALGALGRGWTTNRDVRPSETTATALSSFKLGRCLGASCAWRTARSAAVWATPACLPRQGDGYTLREPDGTP